MDEQKEVEKKIEELLAAHGIEIGDDYCFVGDNKLRVSTWTAVELADELGISKDHSFCGMRAIELKDNKLASPFIQVFGRDSTRKVEISLETLKQFMKPKEKDELVLIEIEHGFSPGEYVAMTCRGFAVGRGFVLNNRKIRLEAKRQG